MQIDKKTGPLVPLVVSHGDIVRAHNLLNAVLTGKVAGLKLNGMEMVNLYAYRDFACWMLGHTPTNPTVERVLAELRRTVTAQGYDLDQIQLIGHLNGNGNEHT